jgi:hypothetical protein
MAIQLQRAIVQVTLPRAEAQEFLAELTLDLGLRIRLLHGRMTEQKLRLLFEMAGKSEGVKQGIRRSERRNARPPLRIRAS